MGLLIGVGDFGIGDLINKAQNLYDLLQDLCGNQLDWQYVLNKPNNVAGYGILDVFTKQQVLDLIAAAGGGTNNIYWSQIINPPTTLGTYGITDAYTQTAINNLLLQKAEKIHTHQITDIVGLESLLDGVAYHVVETMPSNPLPKALYLVRPTGSSNFKAYVTSAGPTVTSAELDAVTYAQFATGLAAKQNKLTGDGTQVVMSDGTFKDFTKESIGLGRIPNLYPEDWPLSNAAIAALTGKADNAGVLHKDGDETKSSGVLNFVISPLVPTPEEPQQAANKGYVDGIRDDLAGRMVKEFDVPENEWLWIHNMNMQPDVLIVINGRKANSDVQYLDNDSLKVVHSEPQVGSLSFSK